MKKDKLSGVRILVAVLLIFALIFALAAVLIFAYARSAVDYGADELLFAAQEEGTAIRLMADATPGDGVFDPVEFEAVYPGAYKKEWVAYADIPKSVVNAFLSMEDRSFFEHKGVSLLRTAKAAVNYLLGSPGGSFGGSTVTQQVIKNISGNGEYTVKRKITEMLRAVHAEQMHSKEEILEVYLNILPMGESIVGVGLAAEHYFGKSLPALSLDEIAVLVGIANAPGRYNPHTAKDACLEKRNRVLFAMKDNGMITEEEYGALCSRPLEVKEEDAAGPEVHSWFAETVLAEIREDLCAQMGIGATAAEALLSKGGLTVYTTVDPFVQKTLEQHFADKKKMPSQCKDGLELSMVVVDSKSGELRGIVGRAGEKEGNRLLNHALLQHTPGSALKPLALYAPLIDSGRIHPATVLDDVPLSFTKNGTDYREYPKNHPSVYSGLITVKDALRLSKNTVAVRLYQMQGAERIYQLLTERLGLSGLVRSETAENGKKLTDLAAAPLALGQLTHGVSLRGLTEAYTVFPSEGVKHSGKSYLAVYDASGGELLSKKSTVSRVFSAEGARLMNQLLSEVVDSGTAKSITLKRVVDTAGKTGTSGEDRDRVFVGYTPYYTAGIWMGYEGSDRAVGGVSVSHLAVWDGVMQALHARKFAVSGEEAIQGFSTAGLVKCAYCKDSGHSCTPLCALDLRGEREESFFFLKRCRPSGLCRTHFPVYYDLENGCVATEQTKRESLGIVSLLRIEGREFPKPIYVSDERFVYSPPARSEGEGSEPLLSMKGRKRYA